jgi:hypothetical protein
MAEPMSPSDPLTEEEQRTLAMLYIYGRGGGRRAEAVPGEEVGRFIDWCSSVRFQAGILDAILDAHMLPVGLDETGEPILEMTPKGNEYVERVLLPQLQSGAGDGQ